MDYYIEIQLLPDPEFTPTILMGALYSKLHRALVQLQSDAVGVSFPEYQRKPKNLGNRLRLHGTRNDLESLFSTEWLKGMADHTSVSPIKAVPPASQFVCVQRKQFKTNVERMRRRRMKRKQETYEQAAVAIPGTVERKPDLPFATLRSQSTGQGFNLFIDQAIRPEEPKPGEFNCYGLSKTATVPWF